MIIKPLLFVVVAMVLIAIYYAGFKSGKSQTTLQYTQLVQEKNVAIVKEQQKLERALLAVKRTAAKKTTQVEQHFIPVEREVIRYVSKKEPTTCQSDYTQWMQLHNAAATGVSVPDSR
jgi:hypothetical protein